MSELNQAQWVEVAVGLLRRDDKVCLSLRQSHQHLANLWEFPGGKVEQGETAQEALSREFSEELGVETTNWQPLITVPWHYEKVSVRLQVFQTEQFSGEPQGLEGQQVEWCSTSDLSKKSFPKANRGILTALALPNIYMSIGDYENEQACLAQFNRALEQGVQFAQLKSRGLSDEAFIQLANLLADRAVSFSAEGVKGAKLMLNASPEMLLFVPNAAGIQLSSSQAENYQERPVADDKLLAVSTHSREQIEHALAIGADVILISPINKTTVHPDLAPLGWQGLKALVADIPVPVYALGGMQLNDLSQALNVGAHGVMLTKGVWPTGE